MAIELNPYVPDSYLAKGEAFFILGNSLHGLKRYEEALRAYDRAIALNPSFAEAYHKKGEKLT